MVLNHDVNSFDNDAYQWPEIKKKVSDSKFIQKCLRFEPSTMTMEESKRVYDAHLNASVKSAATLKLLKWLINTQKAFEREGTIDVDPKRPLGMKLTKALAVQSMSPGGQFDSLGVKVGDSIIGVGSMRVESAGDFTKALKLYKAQGDPVITIIIKEGEPGKLKKSNSLSSTSSAKSTQGRLQTTTGGPGTSLDHDGTTERTAKSASRVGKSARKPSRPAPKVVADANEPTSFAPKEFGTFRAKGTSIGSL